jgi:hypothetical protein
MEIANFFWEGELSNFEVKCIKSFVNNGFYVKLWSYTNIQLDGVESCDANLVIPRDYKLNIKQTLNSLKSEETTKIATLSDYFRIKLLHLFGGWWFDTDCICLKDVEEFTKIKENRKIVLGKVTNIKEDKHHLSNGILYFNDEISNKVLTEFESLVDEKGDTNQIWGYYGPEFITNFILNNGLYDEVLSVESFYNIRMSETNLLILPEYRKFGEVKLKKSLVTHIWTPQLSERGFDKNYPPFESLLNVLLNHDNLIEMRTGKSLTGFKDFLNYISEVTDIKNISVLEIGSYVGESTRMFADKVKSVISVDPFMNDYDPNDLACRFADIPTKVYQEFQKNISSYSNIKHIRKTSDDAINDLIDEKFDLVYIDGVHTYEQVKKDIENYRKIVKPNGLLCGHDYLNEGHLVGVFEAVNEIFGKPDIIFEDTTWLIKL